MALWWNLFILIIAIGLNSGVFASQPDGVCPGNDFQCTNGRCILKQWKCDSRDDCGDNSDEVGCVSSNCPKEQMSCSNGDCIALLWKCDGENDCPDGGDEKDCHITSCDDKTQLRCDHGQCIPISWACDGTMDCSDGTDERNCSAKPVSCNIAEFRCEDGACIDNKLVCDQRKDCQDGSDELNCTPLTAPDCNSDEFLCVHTNKCISRRWLCDGDDDCDDGYDERPELCLMSSPSTSSSIEKRGCSSGYKLMEDNVTCEDIDECSVPGHCSQICNNTDGGFICKCVEGYVLGDDNRKCHAVGKPAILLYLLADEIRGIELNSTTPSTIYSDGSADCRGMDFDVLESKIFWTDWKSSTLNSYTQNTNEKIELATPKRPEYLKWDWLTRTFFFTSFGSIVACDETGKYFATTIPNAADHISSFDISPKHGIMFWSVWDIILKAPYGLIERADLDGSNRVAIIENSPFRPSSITVDDLMGKIYWVEWKFADLQIEFADFDGHQRKILMKGEPFFPMSMTIFEDDLFWSDYRDTIYRCNKFTGRDCAPVHTDNVKAGVTMMFHKVKQPKGENRCLNNKCHHLCLPNQAGSSCKCSDGYENNNSTCSLISTTNSDVPQTAVITNDYGIDGSTNAEEKMIPTSTPVKDTNVTGIWTKYFIIPVVQIQAEI